MSVLGDDIVTDAVADPPRPRGTVRPDLPKPQNIPDVPLAEENTAGEQSSRGQSSKPYGFFKGKIPNFCDNKYNFVLNHCSSIQFGNVINIGMPNGNQKPKTASNVEVPPKKYDGLLSSTKSVNEIHLDRVAANVGKKWRQLGLLLGRTDADLDRVENDNRNDLYETIYQMLREWNQGTGGPNKAALLTRLSGVLWTLREEEALNALLEVENDPRLNDESPKKL